MPGRQPRLEAGAPGSRALGGPDGRREGGVNLSKWKSYGAAGQKGLRVGRGAVTGVSPPQKLHPLKEARGEVPPSLPGSPAPPWFSLSIPWGLFPSSLKATAELWPFPPRLMGAVGSSAPPCEGLLDAGVE